MARKVVEDWYWQFGADLQQFNDELLRSAFGSSSKPFWEPKVDVFETDAQIVIRTEAAGMKAQNLRVVYNADRHSVTIRGRRTDDWVATHGVACHQLEIFFGEFEREVLLPESMVDSSGLEATYRNGVLLVSIPKVI
jgi:HSP20 family molecular chaperone IbpA